MNRSVSSQVSLNCSVSSQVSLNRSVSSQVSLNRSVSSQVNRSRLCLGVSELFSVLTGVSEPFSVLTGEPFTSLFRMCPFYSQQIYGELLMTSHRKSLLDGVSLTSSDFSFVWTRLLLPP
ncbi:unnamed protein product [Pleuronectes platessa]|uniref:Uncharacterized protein n=1 Tax=Pleuronectes platessa TaxID=8262 RepID=A0A9N7UGK9_PLEPL|nr:unnamed protein product [Pleuronectes platessa]